MGKNNSSAAGAKENKTINTNNANGSKPAETIEEAAAILGRVFKPETEPAEKPTEQAEPTEQKTDTAEAAAKAETAAKEAPQQSPDLFSEPAPKPLTFAEMQAKINAELSRLKEQQERAAKREILVNCKRQMKEYSERLAQTENFEADFCRLSFQTLAEEYNSRQAFKESFLISNPAIIRKFCDILAEEVGAKIKEIETEIING